jgi:hypothetical protein
MSDEHPESVDSQKYGELSAASYANYVYLNPMSLKVQ